MENQDENSHLNTRLLQIIEESEVPEKMKPYLHDGISRMEKNLPSLTNPFERLNFLHFYVSAKMDASQLWKMQETQDYLQRQFEELILKYKNQSEFVWAVSKGYALQEHYIEELKIALSQEKEKTIRLN